MEDHECDVAIVGAGACGAAAAWRLAEAGLDVLLLERGRAQDPAALDRDGPDWEQRRAGPLSPNPNRRAGPDDDPVDDADTPIKPMFAHGPGGTTPHWSAHVPRFRPEDFRVRSLDGVGTDWPLSYDELAPSYEAVERAWGVAFLPGDPSAPPRQTLPRPLPTIGPHGRRVAGAFDRLGWHWWPVDLAVGTGEARQPCAHAGPCDLGCPARRRSDAAAAFLAPALAAGARLLTGVRATAVETDRAGRATAVVCRDDAGGFRVRAAQVMLAGGGSGTPRLLLLSASRRFPDGLANGSGLVGRGLMLHPYGRVEGRFADATGGWAPGEKAGIVSFQFLRGDASRGFPRGLKLQLSPGPGPLALALGAPGGDPLPWGARHHAAFGDAFDRWLGLTVCAEDLPEDRNRVTLSETLRDRDGLPAAKWTYRLSDDSRRALDFGLDRAEEALREAGAVEIARTALRDQAGFHIMGAARMGADPETSVTDAWGRCHEVANLHVVDPSVFVTCSVANPTLTAQALAVRAADRLIARRRGGHGTSSRRQAV